MIFLTILYFKIIKENTFKKTNNIIFANTSQHLPVAQSCLCSINQEISLVKCTRYHSSKPSVLRSRSGGTFQNGVRLESFKLTRSILYGPNSSETYSNIPQFRRGSSLSNLLVPSPVITIYK